MLYLIFTTGTHVLAGDIRVFGLMVPGARD